MRYQCSFASFSLPRRTCCRIDSTPSQEGQTSYKYALKLNVLKADFRPWIIILKAFEINHDRKLPKRLFLNLRSKCVSRLLWRLSWPPAWWVHHYPKARIWIVPVGIHPWIYNHDVNDQQWEQWDQQRIGGAKDGMSTAGPTPPIVHKDAVSASVFARL